MEIDFQTDELKRLKSDASFDAGYERGVVKAYRKRVQFIEASVDERDFYGLKSLHFEKLLGKRKGFFSMRLNDQWRLVLKFRKERTGKTVVVISIEDYH